MASDVFISHAHEDAEVARRVCGTIESRGFRCWLAPRDIPAGADYPSALADALNACRALVLILSSSANASPHVMREVERAVSREVPIVPFRIELVQPEQGLEYLIGSVQWLDATDADRGDALELLVQTLTHRVQAATLLRTQAEDSGHPSPLVATQRPFSPSRRFAALTSFGALGVLAVLALSVTTWWRGWSSDTPPAADSTRGDDPAPPAPIHVGAAATSTPTPEPPLPPEPAPPSAPASAAPSASASGGARDRPAPSKICCTESGIGKPCAQARCSECGLLECN